MKSCNELLEEREREGRGRGKEKGGIEGEKERERRIIRIKNLKRECVKKREGEKERENIPSSQGVIHQIRVVTAS